MLTCFGFFFVFGVGVLGQPQMLHKFYMLDDPRKLKWMPLTLGASQAVCVLIWLGIGLAVPSLVATGRLAPLANPDEASPQFLLNFAPEILAGLVFAGLMEWRGNLLAPVLAHALVNAINLGRLARRSADAGQPS